MIVPTNYCLNLRYKFENKDLLRQFCVLLLSLASCLLRLRKLQKYIFHHQWNLHLIYLGQLNISWNKFHFRFRAFWRAFDRKESQVIKAEFSAAVNNSFLIMSRRMQNRTHVIKINHVLTSSTRPRNSCEEKQSSVNKSCIPDNNLGAFCFALSSDMAYL